MPRNDPIQEATFTGRVTRIYYNPGNLFRKAELVAEMENDRAVATFVAYGVNAKSLSSFLIPYKHYTIDYVPTSRGEFSGEISSARDRNA